MGGLSKLEFAIYKTILAFNAKGHLPDHEDVRRNLVERFPEMQHYAHETISRTTRKMVERGAIQKRETWDGSRRVEGFKVPISLDDRSKALENQTSMSQFMEEDGS